MMDNRYHIDEQTLSRLILNDSTLSNEERTFIEQHFNNCNGCKTLFDEMAEFYSNVTNEINQNETLGERHKKELIRRATKPTIWTESVSAIIPKVNVSVPARMWYFARKKPLISSMSVFTIVAVLSLSFNAIIKTLSDTNPSYLRIESKDLIVYNKNGDIIWKKPIDVSKVPLQELNTYPTKFVRITDTNGDGINEIVTILSFLDGKTLSQNEITAYNNKGEFVWKRELGSSVQYGNHKYSLDFRNKSMVFYQNQNLKRFLVLILHTHSPSAIVSVDEKGNIIGEYYNYGHFQDITLADIDGDGKEVLIATLLDDEKNHPIIAAIDVEGIVGKKQSSFSTLKGIEISDALKYYSFVDQSLPFSNVRYTFNKMFSINGSKIKIEYGPSPEWFYTFTFGEKLLLDDILATDEVNEKYGESIVKNEIKKLKKTIKHWERGKPPA